MLTKKLSRILLTALCLTIFSTSARAEDLTEAIVCKLASLHSQGVNPMVATPDRATIVQFYGILQALKERCTNTETDIADTIVETWKLFQSNGYKLTLLDVTQQLTTTAMNKVVFGDDKVDFRTTSGYWISQSPLGKILQEKQAQLNKSNRLVK